MTPTEALKALIHEMEYVLSCINQDKIPFDGDDFHEALRLGKEALAQQSNEQVEPVGRIASNCKLSQPDRHELQAKGEHPAPCARFCEANAFQIEIRGLKAKSAQQQPEWYHTKNIYGCDVFYHRSEERGYMSGKITPLYTHPPVPTAQPKEPEQEPVAVTAEMARAFHRAISDGPLGQADEFEIQTGLEAAFAHITTPPQPAQPEQEPVAWRIWNPDGEKQYAYSENGDGEPLYTTPPQRKPLTLEQLREHWQVAKVLDMTDAEIDFADYVLITRDVEALHGIKE